MNYRIRNYDQYNWVIERSAGKADQRWKILGYYPTLEDALGRYPDEYLSQECQSSQGITAAEVARLLREAPAALDLQAS